MSVTIETNARELDHHSRPRPFHIVPSLVKMLLRRCIFHSGERSLNQIGFFLATPRICTNIYPICSESLLPTTYQNFRQLPIIYKFFGLACRVLRGLPQCAFPSFSPSSSFQVTSALTNQDCSPFSKGSECFQPP